MATSNRSRIPADDHEITSYCLYPEELARDRGVGWNRVEDSPDNRPVTSVLVTEREKSVYVAVGHNRHRVNYVSSKGERVKHVIDTYSNTRFVFSWRGKDLRVYRIEHTRKNGRKVEQITSSGRYHGMSWAENQIILDAIYGAHQRGLARGMDMPSMVYSTAAMDVPELVQTGAYPMMAEKNGVWAPLRTSMDIATPMRAKTVQEFTAQVFGKKHYRKDLVKAVAASNELWPIPVARHLTDLVPIDWVIEFIRTPKRGFGGYEYDHTFPDHKIPFGHIGNENAAETLLQILTRVSVDSRRRLLADGQFDPNSLRDIARMMKEGPENAYLHWPAVDGAPLRRARSWEQLHDELVAERNELRRRRREADEARRIARGGRPLDFDPFALPRARRIAKVEDQKIPKTKVTEALHKLEITYNPAGAPGSLPDTREFVLKRAKTTQQLADWGVGMLNCIGSYGYNATAGQTNLMALYEGDKMIANLEIYNDGHVAQLFGKMNRSLDMSLDRHIRSCIQVRLAECGLGLKFKVQNEPWHANLVNMRGNVEEFRNLDEQIEQRRRHFLGEWPADRIEATNPMNPAGRLAVPEDFRQNDALDAMRYAVLPVVDAPGIGQHQIVQ